jgi:hypothetical protein
MKKLLGIAVLLIFTADPAWAQLATPEARSFALGSAYTARAAGYEATFWNPANLALATRPDWSAGANASMYFSNNALEYGQVTALYGEYLDAADKTRLLEDVRAATGGDLANMNFDVGAQGVGVSFGRFAAGLSGIGAGSAEITPDALELLLFGNVGENGTGRDFDFSGTKADLWSLYGGYASYAQPFRVDALPMANFSAGATLRFGVARDLLRVTESRSDLVYEPLSLDVALQKLQSSGGSAGTAIAADLGLAMEWGGRLVVGMSLTNAIQTIRWDESSFEVTSYTVAADYENISINSTTLAYDDLDPEARARADALLEDSELPRQLRLGSFYRVSPRLDVSADYAEQIGGKLRSRWDRSLSAGAEFRPVPVIPLRAGVATSFDQFALTAGLGLHAGPAHLDFAFGRWGMGGGDGLVSALSVSFWPGL